MGVSALAMKGDLKTISDETIAELETALRGAGHNIAGKGVHDGESPLVVAIGDREHLVLPRHQNRGSSITLRVTQDKQKVPRARSAGHETPR